MLIIAGDFNARIGQDSSDANTRVIGKHALHEKTNDNGSRLIEFCEATDTIQIPTPKIQNLDLVTRYQQERQ